MAGGGGGGGNVLYHVKREGKLFERENCPGNMSGGGICPGEMFYTRSVMVERAVTSSLSYLENEAFYILRCMDKTCSMEWRSSRSWFYVIRCISREDMHQNDFRISAINDLDLLTSECFDRCC